MLEAIKRLIDKWACHHDWEEMEVVKTYQYATDKLPYKRTYVLKCKKCGEIKVLTIK